MSHGVSKTCLAADSAAVKRALNPCAPNPCVLDPCALDKGRRLLLWQSPVSGPAAEKAIMPQKKPLVIITRRLPDVIETRMMELFDCRLRIDDAPMSQAELVQAAQECDVLVPTVESAP